MEFFGLIYVAVLLIMLIAGIIVVFHLQRYSLDKVIATRTTWLFVGVTLFLVLVATFFFMQIPDDIFLTPRDASRF